MASAKLASPNTNLGPSRMASFTFKKNSMPTTGDGDEFSPYLTLIRDAFSLELGTVSAPNPSSSSFRITVGNKKGDGGEIGVFGAEKYFSGAMDGHKELANDQIARTQSCMEGQRRGKPVTKSCSGSTTSSEASGNSRSTLFRDRRRSSPSNARKQAAGKPFLGAFWCSCSRKQAIDVDKDTAGETSSSRACNKVVSFVDHRDMSEKKEANVGAFGSPVSEKAAGFCSRSLKRKDDDDDLRSEASSDLFEIESLSITGHPFFRPEGAGTCYEPSEASIDWSVVTASAANFSAAASEHDSSWSFARGAQEAARNSWSGHRKPGLLLGGCVSRKAVNVTADAYKKQPAEKVVAVIQEHFRSELLLPPVAMYHTSRPN